jgi:transketolase
MNLARCEGQLRDKAWQDGALPEMARTIRTHVLRMTHRARSSHVGSCFSVVELLVMLYGQVLRVNPADPTWAGRDRMLVSKGHAAAALFSTLAERGFFPVSWLDTFYLDGTCLPGHVTHRGVPGVEISTGALGHGLPIGCGMALVAKREQPDSRVFVVLSDGDCDEGSTWEAALFAHHHRLDNMVAIVDYNKIQGFGRTNEVMNLEPLADKWKAFGWSVREVDGHDIGAIESAISTLPFEKNRPSALIAHTVKGKGVSFMEDTVDWHYKTLTDELLKQAIKEVDASL